MESVGVTVSEWVILREVLGFGAVSPTRLGDAIGMTKGAVSKLITRLEGKRLLTRSVSDADRRNHEVALTPAGKALVPRLARLADRNDEEFFGHLPVPLRTTLVDTLQDIVRVRQLKSKPVD
jgi:DNA-binding MarR family transcriptional regulator